MKITKKVTLKKDITSTLVIRPCVLQSKPKSKRRPEAAWTWGVGGKFSQPEVGGKKFMGYPSFFYSPPFPFIISISFEIRTQP